MIRPDIIDVENEQRMTLAVRDAAKAGMLVPADGGRFSGELSPQQERAVAHLALMYGLDPMMGELVIYHGKPLPTIHARRRKDSENGHRPDIAFQFPNPVQLEMLQAAGVYEPGDLIQICVLKTEWGNTVEGWGKVTKAEREATSKDGQNYRSPVVHGNPLEMCQKRAEMRAREMAYGGLGIPVPFAEQVIDLDASQFETKPWDPVSAEQDLAPKSPHDSVPTPQHGVTAPPRPKPPAPPDNPDGPWKKGDVCDLHDGRIVAPTPSGRIGHFLGKLGESRWCYGEHLMEGHQDEQPEPPEEASADGEPGEEDLAEALFYTGEQKNR